MKIRLYDRTGALAFTLPVGSGSTYTWKKEEEEYVTVVFSSPSVMALKKGYYAEIGGLGRFEVVDLPTPTKSGSNTGYDYELRLDRPWYRFKNRIAFFRRGSVGGAEAKWSLTDTLEAHAAILTDNLANIGYTCGGDAYVVLIHDDVEKRNEAKLIEYDSTTLLSALDKMAETFDTEWWIDGRVIHFGRCEQGDAVVRLEQGRELNGVSRAEDSEEHGTRLYAFGSSRNLNQNYRRKLKGPFTIDGFTTVYTKTVRFTTSKPKTFYSVNSRIKITSGKYAGQVFTFKVVSGSYNSPNAGQTVSWDNPMFEIEAGESVGAAGLAAGTGVQFIIGEDSDRQSEDSMANMVGVERGGWPVFSFKDFQLQKKAVTANSTVTLADGTVSGITFLGMVSDGGTTINGGRDCYALADKSVKLTGTSQKVTLAHLAMAYVNKLYTEPVDGQSDVAIQGVSDTVLQLPIGTPYIDSEPNLDPSDITEVVKTYEDIYPRALLTVTEVTEIEAKTTDTDTGEVTRWTAYRFRAKLQDGTPFVFDSIYETQDESKPLSVHFESGALNGMDFEVHFNPDADADDRQLFEITRNTTYTLELPNETMKPKAGDTLFMYNMDITFIDDSLVAAAENELKAEAEKDMAKMKVDSGSYTATANPVAFRSKGISLTYGSRVNLVAPEYFGTEDHARQSRVIGWELNLDDLTQGEYTIGESAHTSRNESLASTVSEIVYKNDKIQNQQELQLERVKALVETVGQKHFLSKTGDDTAAGLIGFGKGLTTGSYSAGKTGGSLDAEGNAEVESLAVRGDANVGGGLTVGKGSWINADGSARLGDTVADTLRSATFDDVLQRGFGLVRDAQSGKYTMSVTDLMVWGKAVFTELEIRRLYSVGGNVYLSGASGRIQHVAAVYGSDGVTVEGWKCWLLADDGTTATQNCFARYDQAKCQTFGIEEGVHEGVGNRYYWRLVTDASTASEEITDADGNVLYEGKRFAWVVLSATDCEDAATNDAPAAGDVIVLDGHRQFAQGDAEGRDKYNDATRTNVMTLETTGEESGAYPRIVALTGVTGYAHSSAEDKYSNTVFILSPEDVVFVSSRFKWIRKDGTVADAETVWGGIEASVDGLSSEFGALEKDLQGSDPTTLKRYTSAIKQSARGISLEVAAQEEKVRNLLGGTAFGRKDATLWLETEADTADLHTGGYGGANYVRLVKKDSIADMRYYGIKWGDAETRDGTQCPNIQVRKGKYTLAFMMRKSSATGIYCDTQVLKGGGPWTRADNMGSMVSGSVQTASETSWKLVTYTLDVTADCWLCVMVRMRAATDRQGVWVDVCQPCLVEGDFYSWREGAQDYARIGGNLLDNTRGLGKGGNLTTVGGTVGAGADGTATVTLGESASLQELLEWSLDGVLKLGQDYMFSFWAKGSGRLAAYMYHGSDGIGMTAEGSNGDTVTGWADGNINFALTDVWTRCWVHWRNDGTGQADRVLLRVPAGTSAAVTKPKLEEGAAVTEWTDNPQTYVEEGSLAQRLYATGFNITDGSIDMTADKFTLRNNKGERSFDVDAEGDLVARSLRSETKDGTLAVDIAAGAFMATTTASGASAFIGLLDGMPCLQFTNLAGVVTYAIGAAGAVVNTDEGLKLTGVAGGYTVWATTAPTEGWTVMYSVSVTVRNTSQESVQVSPSSLTLAITGFTKTLTPLMQLSAADTQLGLGYAVVMAGDERTFSFATAAETVARKNADGSYNAEPSGTRGCEVRYAGKRIGMGAAKKV